MFYVEGLYLSEGNPCSNICGQLRQALGSNDDDVVGVRLGTQ